MIYTKNLTLSCIKTACYLQVIHVFLLLLILLLSACSSQQSVKPAATVIESRPDITVIAPQQAVKIDDKYFAEGVSALQQNDLDRAKLLFEQFIRNNPELSGAYINLALIHFKQAGYAQSLTLTNRALTLNPSQAQAYQLRAQLHIINGNINDAKKDYLRAIELNPDYINAQYNLALLYDIYFQQIDFAIKHYEIYMTLIGKPDKQTKEWINHLKGTLKNG